MTDKPLSFRQWWVKENAPKHVDAFIVLMIIGGVLLFLGLVLMGFKFHDDLGGIMAAIGGLIIVITWIVNSEGDDYKKYLEKQNKEK